MTLQQFIDARFGLFVHYGLYSLLQRGEWVWNREVISREEYSSLATQFRAEHFDADVLCRSAHDAGMKYIVLTTMHHDGFRLYPTNLSDFHVGNSAAVGRDLVAEVIEAARKHGLYVGLYHSLNNWFDSPDAVDALEDPRACKRFIQATHERIRELLNRYNPVDILWYDGWWPFNAEEWQAEEMNAMVRSIQPHILFNGRNGLPGDFATPEQHLSAPVPWRPWEACVTLNESWGFHAGDHDWKTDAQILDMLVKCAQDPGNLLLNIGPKPDGSVPIEAGQILQRIGNWLSVNGESITSTDPFNFDLQHRGSHRSDWNYYGPMTAKSNNLYWFIRRSHGTQAVLGGLETRVQSVRLLSSGKSLRFQQTAGRVVIDEVPASDVEGLWPVLKLECDAPPVVYQTGGLRVPTVEHPHYDPCPSDIRH